MMTNPKPIAADAAGIPPEWVEILPTGPTVAGVDGRSWLNDQPDAILAEFARRITPMVIDWEHSTEHRAAIGLDAPAAGWIDRLEIRGGAIWGHVSAWTERAAQQIAAKEYRFLSPVFAYEVSSRRILALKSVALTNSPNLPLAALRSEFPDVEIYAAYRRAEAAGLISIVGESGAISTANACNAAMEFANNSALQTEFGDVETYVAYRRAEAAGFVSILKKGFSHA